ncbi:Ig domain-containing protein [Edaphobacter aggregans]|uniref:Ig domain-containing protein n=1 Tax=Edaphobacter aggregans TaxID=570835 RepID=UPI000F73E452|nr:Ig domain-containing protein [Edaphobacter aggregans]
MGTQSQIIKVTGQHFANQAAILWNGHALPTTVVDSNTLSGAVQGSNLAAPATVQLKVQNLDNGQQSQPMPVTVAAAATSSSQLVINSVAVSGAMVNQPYASAFGASGGTPVYTWSITSGQLPAGLSLVASTGVISGIPTVSGTFNFTISVADSASPAQSVSTSASITVSSSQLAILSPQFPSGGVGTAYSIAMKAAGGTPAYTWSITSGQLPTGLSMGSSSGVISGTPTVGGTFKFTISVADSASPAQSISTSASITVSSSQLTILSPLFPSGGVGTAYSIAMKAAGGTPTYTWSITSGQLPTGLSMGSSSGVISGTPTVGGTFNFTISVADSSNPAQSVSTSASVSVGSSQLAITSSVLSSGIVDTAYSTALQASGGTPAYTWSIAAGSLPAGLTLAATTGVISGTPTTSGTSKFIASLTDNSNPAQTQSTAMTITVAAAQPPTGPGTTWYVRPDGGTRYSSNVTTGQCDGKADAPYSGSGVNQHCAFNDVRMLYQDGTYNIGASFPAWGWVIAGGDTVLIRGSIGTGVSYRIGWNGTTYDGWGIAGDPWSSGMPPPPSGTASQHTRILGENYASCHSASAKTQLHGGRGAYAVMSLYGASYVDVACLDITDFSACGRATQKVGCDSTQDFAQVGIQLHNTSTHDSFTDIHIHGLAGAGVAGSTGDGVVMDYVDILGNASSGWNADEGDGTTGVGSLLVSHFNISWNGCAEEYPIVDSVPYGDCTDQSSGGYGDGFGTATVASPSPGWQVHFDNGTVSYNTQDGLDALHISGPGSTMTDTRVLAYGNEGQQLKVGGATATIQDSVIVGNCEAMTTQAIPGTPAGFGSVLASPCRAANTAVVINVTPGYQATFQGNTVFTQGSIGLEVEYATADTGPTNTLQFNDNIFVGFPNSGNGANPTPIYSNTDLKMLTNPGASWSNNSYFGYRNNWMCPAVNESNALCIDPGLVDETYHPYGYGNMAPASSSSPVVGAGVAVPSIPLDYTGVTRPNPPSIGAYEFPQ